MLTQSCGHPGCKMAEDNNEASTLRQRSLTQENSLESSVVLGRATSGDSFLEDLSEIITRKQCIPDQQLFKASSSALLTSICPPKLLSLNLGVTRQPSIKVDCLAHYATTETSFSTPLYPIAHGQQVSIQEQDGRWFAQVQDIWGRTQVLPVVCAPNQTPEQAIELLSYKPSGHYRYWIHILDLAVIHSLCVSRVVYVGALGLRGGGNSASSSGASSMRGGERSYRSRDERYSYRDATSDRLFSVTLDIPLNRSTASEPVGVGIRTSGISSTRADLPFSGPIMSEPMGGGMRTSGIPSSQLNRPFSSTPMPEAMDSGAFAREILRPQQLGRPFSGSPMSESMGSSAFAREILRPQQLGRPFSGSPMSESMG
ncbi:MAG: hypothetical protein ACX93T_01540, partial [Bacteroidota bacterium]